MDSETVLDLLDGFTEEQREKFTNALLTRADSILFRTLEKKLIERDARETQNRNQKATVVIRQMLHTSTEETFNELYPEFKIVYKSATREGHSPAAASRTLETHLLLSKCGGPTFNIVDLGGNYASHILGGRSNVHSCCPLLDLRDSAREVERQATLQGARYKYNLQGKSLAALNSYEKNPEKHVCHNRCEDCDHKADYMIAVHSIYDVTLEQFARAMVSHDCKVAFGCFIFDEGMLLQKEGTIKPLNAHYVIDIERDIVSFSFEQDSSQGYTHRWSQYIRWVTAHYLVVDKHAFWIELLESRGGVRFFKMVRCPTVKGRFSRFQHNLWFSMFRDAVIVDVFDFRPQFRSDIRHDLVRSTVVLPARFVNDVLEYAYGLKEADITYESVFAYSRSVNCRFTANGMDITSVDKVCPEDIRNFAIVVAVKAKLAYADVSQITGRLRLDHQMRRDQSGKGFFRTAGAILSECVSKLGHAVFGPGKLTRGLQGLLRYLQKDRDLALAINAAPLYRSYASSLTEKYSDPYCPQFDPVTPILEGNEPDIGELISVGDEIPPPSAPPIDYQSMLSDVFLKKPSEFEIAAESTSTVDEYVGPAVEVAVAACSETSSLSHPVVVTTPIVLSAASVSLSLGSDSGVSATSSSDDNDSCRRLETPVVPFSLPSVNHSGIQPSAEALLILPPQDLPLDSAMRPHVSVLLKVCPGFDYLDYFQTLCKKSYTRFRNGPKAITFRDVPVSFSADFFEVIGWEFRLDRVSPATLPLIRTAFRTPVPVKPELLMQFFGLDESLVRNGYDAFGYFPGIVQFSRPCEINQLIVAHRTMRASEINASFAAVVSSDSVPAVCSSSPSSPSVVSVTASSGIHFSTTSSSAGSSESDQGSSIASPQVPQTPSTSSDTENDSSELLDPPAETLGAQGVGEATVPYNHVASHLVPVLRSELNPTERTTVTLLKDLISDFENYLKIEDENVRKQAALNYDKIVLNSVFSKTALQSAYVLTDCGLLEKTSDKTYKALTFSPDHYDLCYDGKNFLPLDLKKATTDSPVSASRYRVDSTAKFLYVDKFLKLCQTGKYIHRLNQPDVFTVPEFRLVEGVPGCGKTTDLISRAVSGDLILTVTRETRLEISDKIKKTRPDLDVTVRTVDSFLINEKKFFKRVLFDEGLMVHPGAVAAVSVLARAEEVTVFGDRQQLPFIPRVAKVLYNPKYPTFPLFSEKEMRSVSYRCPQDVAATLDTYYSSRFQTTSSVVKSMEVVNIYNISDVPNVEGVKYLTFTQSEKNDLSRAKKFDVNTIHEVQGKTYEKVYVVRLSRLPTCIYSSDPHILVGLSRHTKEFKYYTVMKSDKMSNMVTVVPKLHGVLVANAGYDFKENRVRHYAESCNPPRIPPPKAVVTENSSPLSTMQCIYEKVFPLAATEDRSGDTYQVHHRDLVVELSDCSVDFSKRHRKIPRTIDPLHPFVSRLRTGQPLTRPPTQTEAILTLVKRNMNVPKDALPSDVVATAHAVLDKFLDTFCLPGAREKLIAFQNDPIRLSWENMSDWALHQKPDIFKQIQDEWAPLTDSDVHKYTMMIKREPKNTMEDKAVMSYTPLQSIIYHSKKTNSVYGSLFRQIYARFEEIIKPNVCIQLRKSPAQICEHMNKCLSRELKERALEIDFSKFDKSQGELCYEAENLLFRKLGLDRTLHDLWKRGHATSVATDYNAGVRVLLSYQRRSGDAITCFGNTIISMMSLAYCLDLKDFKAAYFIGDDSSVFSDSVFKVSPSDLLALANVFNFESKIVTYDHSYFCSSFVTTNGSYIRMIPDPLKKVERLSKGADSEQDIQDRHTSFRDSIACLGDATYHPALNRAMRERYKCDFNFDCLFGALHALAMDYNKFRALYKKA